jgi:hypothetical protein
LTYCSISLRRRLAEHGLRGIAGNEMNQQEHERGNAEQYWNRQRHAASHEPQHGVIVG